VSKVRMCDDCGNMFSERARGWTEAPMKMHDRYDDGSPDERMERMDLCPECTRRLGGAGEPPVPQIRIQGIPDVNQKTLPGY
jgi:hypothetical protein